MKEIIRTNNSWMNDPIAVIIVITIYILVILAIIGVFITLRKTRDNFSKAIITPKKAYKLVRIDLIENDIKEIIYEITIIDIEKGVKKKRIITEGNNLYDLIINKDIGVGGVFYE